MANINIGGRLHSTATGNIVTGANEILDDNINKKQSEINAETYRLVENINKSLENLSPEQTEALSVAEKANNNEVKLGYFECETESDIAAKVIANASGYILSKGGSIKIKMINDNIASNVTLNINSTGAKTLYYNNELVSPTNTWKNNEIIEVYYDGNNYYANNIKGAEKFATGEKIKEVGIDDEPTARSENLVKSSGVFNSLNKVPTLLGDTSNADLNIGDDKGNVILELKDGHIKTKKFDSRTRPIDYVKIAADESDANLNIGDNDGNILVEFKEGHLKTKHFDSRDMLGTPLTFNTEQCLCSICPSNLGHYLSKVAFAGDSLIANQLGGSIPVDLDEGVGKRPMRLLSNSVARRFYDKYCWNKPQWRRLDSAYNAESNPNGWVISGFSTFTEDDLFAGTQEVYYTSSVENSYARITIPDGFENFAIIVRTKSGNGVLGVTINGNLPSTITYQNPIITYNTEMTALSLRTKLTNNTTINSSVVQPDLPCGLDQIDTNIGITGHGNPYAIYQWNNLPSGDNTIELKNISGRTDIWGGFYWSGNTMVVINCAHGGHTINALNHHYPDELYSVDYDSIIFEIPEMNNLRETLDVTISGIKNIFNNLSGKDVLYTSCQALGKSIVYDTNYYTYYTNPTQKELNTIVRELMFKYDKPFLDLFTYYEIMTKLRGGTIEDGDVGLYFTWDGQHGNEVGVGIWFESIASIVRTKPLNMFI